MSSAAQGNFQWKRRMGVHEAYHRNTTNRIIHWLCIPLELWAVVKLLTFVPIYPSYGIDLALVLIVALAPIYILTEPLLGALMTAFLLACWYTAHLAAIGTLWIDLTLAILLFAGTFAFQVAVGHNVFEDGRDDTEKNLKEFGNTKNPIPLILVFYYHLVEIALNIGYRPALKREIQAFTDDEIASWS